MDMICDGGRDTLYEITQKATYDFTAWPRRNQAVLWAPAEPNIYRNRLCEHVRAPEERNVSGNGASRPSVSFRWSEEEIFFARAFYKHYVPTGRGTWG